MTVHAYKHSEQTPNGSIWKTSLINNLMGLIFSAILWPAVIYVATTDLIMFFPSKTFGA